MAAFAASSVTGGTANYGAGAAAAGGPFGATGGTALGGAAGGGMAAGGMAMGTNGGVIANGGAGGGVEVDGCAGAFCDGTGAVTTTGWQYVGQGKGGYSQVSTYNYTGQGAGDWERVVSTNYSGWRFKPCCYALPLLLLLLPLLWYLMTSTKQGGGDEGSNSEQTGVSILPSVAPTKPPINCLDKTSWDHHKQEFCCTKFRIGCPTPKPKPTPKPTPPPTPAPTPPPLPFNCFTGVANWAAWPVNKKVWCCAEKHIGCHPPTPAPAPAAPPPPPASSLPYDCAADWTTCYTCLQHRWSVAKRTWCCDHGGRGCPTAFPPPAAAPPVATSAPYDCDADYTTCHHCLEKRWSVSKRNWCCTNQGRGCHAFPGIR